MTDAPRRFITRSHRVKRATWALAVTLTIAAAVSCGSYSRRRQNGRRRIPDYRAAAPCSFCGIYQRREFHRHHDRHHERTSIGCRAVRGRGSPGPAASRIVGIGGRSRHAHQLSVSGRGAGVGDRDSPSPAGTMPSAAVQSEGQGVRPRLLLLLLLLRTSGWTSLMPRQESGRKASRATTPACSQGTNEPKRASRVPERDGNGSHRAAPGRRGNRLSPGTQQQTTRLETTL